MSADTATHRYFRPTDLLEYRGESAFSVAVLGIVAATGYVGLLHPGLASIVVFAVVFSEFVKRMGQGIPLMQITALLATLQWLVGPSFTYYLGYVHGRYFMYVPDAFYFHYTLPGTCVFAIAVLSFGGVLNQKAMMQTVDRRDFFNVGLVLLAIAIGSQLLADRMPGGLGFLFHLLSQLRYVGALYFLFSGHRYRYLLAIGCCVPLFFVSAKSGMFHDLILWLMMLSTYWVAQFRWKLSKKTVFILVGLVCVLTIQVIKQDYREKMKAGKSPSLLGEIVGAFTEERFFEEDVQSLAVARLNQGWIISSVLGNVPNYEPFAEGETIKDAFMAALVPRILWKEKKRAGGQENFMRFTGLPLEKGTSMGISPLGEGYANFGVEGGIAFMAIFGLGFALLYHFVAKHAVQHADLMFWIPLIFYQGIKAETEMVVILNQLTKGAFVVFVGYYGVRLILLPMLFKQYSRHLARSTTSPQTRLVGRP